MKFLQNVDNKMKRKTCEKHTGVQHECLCPCGDPVCPLTRSKGRVTVCAFECMQYSFLATREVQGSDKLS